jgi:hypothetical protein
MNRHRWNWNDNGSGKCKHCGAKTKLVARKKERGTGKTTDRVYSTKIGKVFAATKPPRCIAK